MLEEAGIPLLWKQHALREAISMHSEEAGSMHSEEAGILLLWTIAACTQR